MHMRYDTLNSGGGLSLNKGVIFVFFSFFFCIKIKLTHLLFMSCVRPPYFKIAAAAICNGEYTSLPVPFATSYFICTKIASFSVAK